MTNIKKVIQTSEIERKDYKRELNKFFANYRATLHPSTGCTPAELLFNGRQFCTRLPQVPAGGTYKPELVRKKDHDMKTKNKSYYDQQNRTRVSEIEVGDKVLVKQRQVEKRTSAFRPTPMVITAKKGSMLTAEGGGKTITRNSSYFKKLHADFRLLNKETTYSYFEDEDSEDEDPDYDHHFMPEEDRCSRSGSNDQHSPGTFHT